MSVVFDTIIALIALTFLGVLGLITGAAIPSLFSPLAAALLDRVLPDRKRQAP